MTDLVSVALVTRDGMATLPALLDGVCGQRTGARLEIVAVDSGSADGSRELLAQRADRLLDIAPRSFNHGLTRNLAIEHCRGELVVLLVQDAVPASPDWLEELIAPLVADPTVAGSFARQRARAGADRLERWNLERWVAAGDEPRIRRIPHAAAWSEMTPMERLDAAAFDNVCSSIRRSVWRRCPFSPASFAEDLEWGRDVLLAGYGLAYAPAAVVVHSHRRSLSYELERTTQAHHRLGELFALRTVPTLRHLLRALVLTAVEHLRVVRQGGHRPGPRELGRALGLAVVWPLGQYLGGRAARSSSEPRPRGSSQRGVLGPPPSDSSSLRTRR